MLHILYTPFLIYLDLLFLKEITSSPVIGTVYTHFVYTVPHILDIELFLKKVSLVQLEERCTQIWYTPFLIYLTKHRI